MSSTGQRAPALPTTEAPPSFLRGRRYGEDRLYLLVRDPRTVMALWEVTPRHHQEGARYELRIERRASHGAPSELVARVDLPDALGGERWYVPLPRSGGECRALLGADLPEGFRPLLESTWVPVPPDGPCAEEGAWDLTPEARAWLDARARAARGADAYGGSGYAARFGPR